MVGVGWDRDSGLAVTFALTFLVLSNGACVQLCGWRLMLMSSGACCRKRTLRPLLRISNNPLALNEISRSNS